MEWDQILITAPEEAAEAANLRYISDNTPGITRRRRGRGFAYLDAKGRAISDPARREHFKALAIPPAWTEVWICPRPNGHIQATGRDEKGRKQYIYHPEWEVIRNETKFNRLLLFGEALPQLWTQVDKDLRRHGVVRERVLAAVVRLLGETFIRVGNEEYARQNGSYGLTTMRQDHIDVNGATLHFEFRGKSGQQHRVNVKDPRVARIVKQCQELPGYELFQYLDEGGQQRTVDSADVNEYLRAATGQDFTAKDFRTWGGTVEAVRAFYEVGSAESEKQADKNIVQTMKRVSAQLGNTATICRKYYVHPAVI
jgi:DNA topoisomerase-1